MILALRRSGKQLTTLSLRRIDELLVSEEFDESKADLEFPSLQHLRINTTNVTQHVTWGKRPPEVSAWVNSLKGLKTLTILQHPSSSDEPDIFVLLAKTNFPALAEIDIKHARATFLGLSRFVARHFDELRSIKILKPVLSADKWSLFRSGFFRNGRKIHHEKKIVLSETAYVRI